jgi:plasmid stability protein
MRLVSRDVVNSAGSERGKCESTRSWLSVRAVLSMIAMSQLVVRNLPAEIVVRLRKRAAENGRSAEAEHREILRAALMGSSRTSLKEYLLEMPPLGEDADFARTKRKSRRASL